MTTTDAVPVLAVTDVRKAFVTPAGPQPVLEGVDLRVAAGEVVAISGRSGSGKTTLLTIITGWARPDAGSVELCGMALVRTPHWHEVAFLPQSLGLLDELTVAENVTLPLRLGPPRGTSDDHPAEVMARLGIDHLADRHPREASLGEQQRAALARAAVSRPTMLIADEPISHQNREWGEVMVGLIGRLAAHGTACVLATHNELAFEGADRVLDLDRGQLQFRPR